MRKRALPLIPVLLLLAVSLAVAQEILKKEKQETYFLELGEVFFKSDEFDISPAFYDGDGEAGPAPLEPILLPSDDVFTTDPRVVLGMNQPGGKSAIVFTAWQFNAEDFLYWDTNLGPDQTMVPTTTIPALILTRRGGINPLEDVYSSHERDLKYASGNWERNIHETKKHRTRLILGLKFVQFEEKLEVVNLYGTESRKITTTYIDSQDRQQVFGNVTSERLGLNVGIESRLKLGKRFRLTSRFELAMSEESLVVQYRNLAGETFPSVGFSGGGIQVAGFSAPPLGIHDRELISRLNLFMDDSSDHKIVPVGEVSIRGSWDLGKGVEAGLEYRMLGLYDMPSARGAIERVRDSISPIDVDIVGVDETPTDPDDDRVVYNYTVDDIVKRHDVVFYGANVFLVFHF